MESRGERDWTIGSLLVVIVLLGFALRLYQLDGKGLWYDELGTALYASADKSPLEVVRGPLEVPVIPAPPLYFLSTYGLRMLGESDFLLRLPSVFFGVLAIAVVYVLGHALIGPRPGVVVAFLLSISPFHIRYSQEARYYGLLMLLGTLSLYFFWRGLQHNDRRSWVAYTVVSTLAVYTHLFAFLFLAVQTLYALSSFPYRRIRAGFAASARSWKQDPLFSFLASGVSMALLYLPMLPFTLRGLLGRKGLGGEIPTVISRTSLGYLAGIVDLFGAGPGLPLLCFLAAFGVGLYVLFRRERPVFGLASLWMVLPFAVVLLVPAGHSFRLRYVIFVLPVFLLVVSQGLVGLSRKASEWAASRLAGERESWIIGPTSLAVIGVLLAAMSLGALQRYWREEKQPWDKAAGFLQRVVEPSDVVIAPVEAHARRLLYFDYSASEVEYLVPCPCPAPVSIEDWYLFNDLSEGHQMVWLLDPNPNYRYLRPGGALAQELDSYIFLPPVVFRGYSGATAVQRDLLAPFATSDIAVQLAVSADSQLSNQEIIRLGSSVADRANELFPQGTHYHFTMGELYRFYGSEEQAVSHYQAAVADDPNYYPAYEGLALIHIARGEPEEALELAESLVARGIVHESYYHFLLGSLHYVEGDLAAALAEFKSAVRLDADNVDYRLRLGDTYRALGRVDEAVAQYDEITRLNPSRVGAYSRRASVHRATGHLAEAVEEYREALGIRPDSAYLHAMLADTYWHQGLMDDAVLEAREAVRLEDTDAAYHMLLGELYQALERIPEAIGEFETAVSLAPEFVPFQVELGAAYRAAGQDEQAIAAFERVLELDRGNAQAKRALQELR